MVQVWKRFHALDVREKGKQPVWLQRSLGAYSCLATDPDAAQEPALLLEVAQVYVCMGAVDGAVAILQRAVSVRRKEDLSSADKKKHARDVARGFHRLAILLRTQKHWEASTAAMQSALKMRDADYPPWILPFQLGLWLLGLPPVCALSL